MCDADLSAGHPDPMVQRGRDRVQRRNMDPDVDCDNCGFDTRFHGQDQTCPTVAELDPCLCGLPAHPDDSDPGCGQYRPISDYGRTEPVPPFDLSVRTVHAVIPVTREWCEDRMIPIPDGNN